MRPCPWRLAPTAVRQSHALLASHENIVVKVILSFWVPERFEFGRACATTSLAMPAWSPHVLNSFICIKSKNQCPESKLGCHLPPSHSLPARPNVRFHIPTSLHAALLDVASSARFPHGTRAASDPAISLMRVSELARLATLACTCAQGSSRPCS